MQKQGEVLLGCGDITDSRIRTISSLLNVCERTTINLEKGSLTDAIKAVIIICLKFVDKEALFQSVVPNTYIDWDFVKGQASLLNGKKNMLGDGPTWLHLMQFVTFAECSIPDRVMQMNYPPLYCLHLAIMSSGTGGKLNFSDACKLLLLNNIEGLTTKRMIELHTSSRLNCNTHAICAGELLGGFLCGREHVWDCA